MENNEKKRIGRRAIIGGSALGLVSAALVYIVETLKTTPELLELGMKLFGSYTGIVFGVTAFIIGGLSATDIFIKKK